MASLAFLALICLVHPALAVAGQGGLVPPAIRVEVVTSGETHILAVIGHGFTPGGMVFITMYDQGGMAVPGTHVVASHHVFQPPVYLEPGEGFSFDTGGNIREEFQGLVTGTECLTPLWIQAYDHASGTLSNVVDAYREC